jgi:hypothetical protein
MKNSKITVRILSVVMLLAVLLTVAAPTALAADEDSVSNKVDFVLAEDARYTAIGSGYSVADQYKYSTLIAKRYHMTDRMTVLDTPGLRVSDMRALLDASYENDAYGRALFENLDVESLRAEYINSIKNSDIITVDLGVEDFTSYAASQLISLALRDYKLFATLANNMIKLFPKLPNADGYEFNWAQFKGETPIEDINTFLESIKVEMTANGININKSMDYLEESLLEAGSSKEQNFAFSISLADIAGEIDIPEDLSMSIGNANDPKYNAKISFDSKNLNIEIHVKLVEYVQYVVETYMYAFANYAYNYAEVIKEIRELNPDATIVIIGKSNFFKNMELGLEGVHLDFNAYANDFVYMLNQVAENYALNDDKAVYVPCLDMETIFDATYTDRSIVNTLELDRENSRIGFNNDVLTPSVNGHAYIAGRIVESLNVLCDHKYTFDCQQLCGKCSEPRENSVDHTYDNACDIDCNVCAEERAFSGHIYDGCTDGDCNECGATRTPTEHTYGGDCDIDCNTCGNLREGSISHTYDSSCDEYCNVCNEKNTNIVHAFGDFVVTKEATTTESGVKTRTCASCGATETEEIQKLTPAPKDNGNKSVIVVIVCIAASVAVAAWIVIKRVANKKSAKPEEPAEKVEETVEVTEDAADAPTEETEASEETEETAEDTPAENE